jgi:hypothetical protein
LRDEEMGFYAECSEEGCHEVSFPGRFRETGVRRT